VRQAVIMEAIPDIPHSIQIQLERTAFITRKLIDRVADDNESDEAGHLAPLEIQEYPDFGGMYAHQVEALKAEQVEVFKWRSL
jgi:hypothetical protein